MAEGRAIMTLHSVFIFLQSGETLVSHTSPVVKLDHTLLTGLLTAIREFGHEAIKEESFPHTLSLCGRHRGHMLWHDPKEQPCFHAGAYPCHCGLPHYPKKAQGVYQVSPGF